MHNKKKFKEYMLAFALIISFILIFSACKSQTSGKFPTTDSALESSGKYKDIVVDEARPFTPEESLKITEEKYKKQLELLRELDWNRTENDILKNGNISRLIDLLNSFKDSEFPRFTISEPDVKDIINNISKYYGEKINFRGKIDEISRDIQEDSIKELFGGKKYSKVIFDVNGEKVLLYIYKSWGILSELDKGNKIDFSGWPVGVSGDMLVLVNRNMI